MIVALNFALEMDSYSLDEGDGSITEKTILSILNLESGTVSTDTVFYYLSKHLTYALRQRMGVREQLYDVADAIEFYQHNHKTADLIAVDRRSKNRLGGNLDECPIAAYLVQEALFGEPDNYLSWQAFVTAVIFSNKSVTEKQINKYGRVCAELRRAAIKKEKAQIISDLPILKITEGLVDSSVESALSVLSDGKARELVSSLRWVLARYAELDLPLQPIPALSFSPFSGVTQHSLEIDVETERSNLENERMVGADLVWEPELYCDSLDDYFDIEGAISGKEFEASNNQSLGLSSYWIRASQMASLVDRNLLDDFDKELFADWLRSELGISASRGAGQYAFVLGLSFFLGKPVTDIAQLKCGDKHDLSTLGYYKKVSLPEGGFVPKEENRANYYPVATHIQLPFVRCMEEWFSRNFHEQHDGKTLSDIFGLGVDEIVEKVKGELNKLRKDNRKTRIDLRKLSSHLATEISATTQDPVVVYLLTGKETDRHSVTSYYQIMSVDQLVEIYKKILSSMFPNERE